MSPTPAPGTPSTHGEPVLLPVDAITTVEAWLRPLDRAHARSMVEVIDELPAITVTADHRLVDGHHRLCAHQLGGRELIPAIVLDAGLDECELMARAIEANVRHGRPLGSAERTRLAVGLLAAGWAGSDTELARICGVSRGRVPELRRRALEQRRQEAAAAELEASKRLQPDLEDRLEGQATRRRGSHGRSYPSDSAAQRARIQEAAQQRPTASNAAIAREVGCSATTVASVRSALLVRTDRRGAPGWFGRIVSAVRRRLAWPWAWGAD